MYSMQLVIVTILISETVVPQVCHQTTTMKKDNIYISNLMICYRNEIMYSFERKAFSVPVIRSVI